MISERMDQPWQQFCTRLCGDTKIPYTTLTGSFLVFERRVCIGCPFLTCNCVLLEHRMPSLLPQFKKELFNLIVMDAFPFAFHSLNSKGQLMSEI